jgi:hypothetical protein
MQWNFATRHLFFVFVKVVNGSLLVYSVQNIVWQSRKNCEQQYVIYFAVSMVNKFLQLSVRRIQLSSLL